MKDTAQDSLEQTPLPAEQGTARHLLPVATIGVIGITAIVTSLQVVYPALLPALDRNPDAFRAGEWWRLITPRFVQPDIWPQYVLLAILALVGPTVERRYGSVHWLVLWLVGGITGELVSFAWQPRGAGASMGICGIIGAWLVLLLRCEDEGSWPVAVVVFAFVTDLIGVAAGSVVAGAVGAAFVASVLVQLRRRDTLWRRLMPYLGMAGLLGGLILTGLWDQHGPPLLAGAAVAVLSLSIRR